MTEIKQPKIRFKGYTEDWEECILGDFLYEVSNRGNSDLEFITVREFDTILRPQSNQGYGNIVTDSKKLKAKIILNGQFLIDLTSYSRGIYLSRLDGLTSNTYSVLELTEFGNLEFFTEFLKHPLFVPKLESLTPIGVRQGKKIDQNSLLKSKFRIPQKEEQEVIGSYFKELDNQINALDKKLESYKQFKQTMLKKMFPKNGETTPEIRFKGFTEDWEECKLGDFIIKNNLRNKDLKVSNVESISNKTGFTKQTEQFNGYSVASSDLSNYYVISENTFAYNPSRINVGSIGYKKFGEPISVISPLYVSFYTNNVLNDLFLWYWFKTNYFNRQRQLFSEGGVRDTLSFNKLVNMKITIPKNEEQELVGNYFKFLDCQINALEQKLESYKEFKKAMLQRMFI